MQLGEQDEVASVTNEVTKAASAALVWLSNKVIALPHHEHPVVLPHVSHLRHVPFLTSVKFRHSEHISPS